MAIASNAASMHSSMKGVTGTPSPAPSHAPSHAPSPAHTNHSAQHKTSAPAFGGFTIDTSKFGQWAWRDDSGQLELMVNSGPQGQGGVTADRKDRKVFGNRGVTKTGTMGAGNTLKVKGRKDGRQAVSPLGRRSPLPQNAKVKPAVNAVVTLADVKLLALTMRSQANPDNPVAPLFLDLQEEKEYNEFLVYLLHYFKCYFDKRSLENKPNPMNIEPSHEEKALLADMGRKLDNARKLLGAAYTVLLISVGHRSHQAKKYKDSTRKSVVSEMHLDRGIYENLYSTCVFVVWVTFRRKEDYHVTNVEFDRLLRSESFNKAARQKNVSVLITTDNLRQQSTRLQNNRKMSMAGDLTKPKAIALTVPEYRRQVSNRPPITSIIKQRSPAHVAILANSKEKAGWLFSRRGENALTIKEEMDDEPVQHSPDEFNPSKVRIGILGEKMSLFNSVTLTPLDDERSSTNGAGDGDPPTGATTTTGSALHHEGNATDGSPGLSRPVSRCNDTSKSSTNMHNGPASIATTDIADDISDI